MIELWLVHFEDGEGKGEASELLQLEAGDWGEGLYCIVEAESKELAEKAAKLLMNTKGDVMKHPCGDCKNAINTGRANCFMFSFHVPTSVPEMREIVEWLMNGMEGDCPSYLSPATQDLVDSEPR